MNGKAKEDPAREPRVASREEICAALSRMLAAQQPPESHAAPAAGGSAPAADGPMWWSAPPAPTEAIGAVRAPELLPTSSAPLPSDEPRAVSASEAVEAQTKVLDDLRAQRAWLQRLFDQELARELRSTEGEARELRVRALFIKFDAARDELLRREKLQSDSLRAMQEWEAAGRPSREAGVLPIFGAYQTAAPLERIALGASTIQK